MRKNRQASTRKENSSPIGVSTVTVNRVEVEKDDTVIMRLARVEEKLDRLLKHFKVV